MTGGTLRSIYRHLLGAYDRIEIGYLECSADVTAYGNLDGSSLRYSLGSINGLRLA